MNKIKFIMVEEAPGHFYYHIGVEHNYTKSLCEKTITMMPTEIPLDIYGMVTHLRERYCDKCKKIYDSIIERKD